MRAECPSCRRISVFPDDQLVTQKNPLERTCPACKAQLALQLHALPEPAPEPVRPRPVFVEIDDRLPASDDRPSANLLKSRILRSLIKLPPMPQIILKAQEIMADPDSSLRDLARVIETDQALVARVLGLANSAYYGLSGTVSTVQQASVLLGQKNLGEMILLSASASLFSGPMPGYRVSAAAIWRHSLAVAYGAKILIGRLRPQLENDAFVAGLLHDAGKLILDPFVRKSRELFTALVPPGEPISIPAEKEVLGIDHAEVMSRACRFWRFPEQQVLAVRQHHQAPQKSEDALAGAVYLSNLLAKAAGFDAGSQGGLEDSHHELLRFIGVAPDEVETIGQQVKDAVSRFEEELRPVRPRPDYL